MTKEIDEKMKPIQPILKALRVGESTKYPLTRLNAVRTSCSMFGLQWGMKFKTTIVRNEHAVQVTRLC